MVGCVALKQPGKVPMLPLQVRIGRRPGKL